MIYRPSETLTDVVSSEVMGKLIDFRKDYQFSRFFLIWFISSWTFPFKTAENIYARYSFHTVWLSVVSTTSILLLLLPLLPRLYDYPRKRTVVSVPRGQLHCFLQWSGVRLFGKKDFSGSENKKLLNIKLYLFFIIKTIFTTYPI